MTDSEDEGGISEWLCGGCGQVHGWVCPYFGYPGESLKWPERKRQDAERRMRRDLAKVRS